MAELARNRAAWDLILTTADAEVGLMLDRPQTATTGARRAGSAKGLNAALRSGEALASQEQRALYADWSGGAGYGERPSGDGFAAVYHWAEGAYCRRPTLVLPAGRVTQVPLDGGVTGTIRGGFELGHDFWVVGGNAAWRLPLGTGTPYLHQRLDANSSFEAFSALAYNGKGYVAGEGQGIWEYTPSTGAWVQSSEVRRKFLATVYWVRGNRGTQRLVGSSIGGAVSYQWATASVLYTDAASPLGEGDWSSEIQVGNAEYSITGLAATNQHLYVLKTNGLHDLDDRLYSPNITAYRQNTHELNNPTKPVLAMSGYVYFGSEYGMERVPLAGTGQRQDRPQQCEFGFGLPNSSPIWGEPRAICNDRGWTLCAYFNPSTNTSYICAGIDYRDLGVASPGLGGPLLWHGAEAVLPNVRVDWLYRAAPEGDDYAPRLWIGGQDTQTGRCTLHWQSLPRSANPYQDWKQGGPMLFADEWTLTLPRDTLGNDAARKDLTRLSVRGDNLGTAALEVSAALDGAAFGATADGRSTTTYDSFALDTPSDARDYALRLRGTGGVANPAVLRALEAQMGITVEATSIVTYTTTWGEGTVNHNGTPDRRDPELIEATLLNLLGQRMTLRNEQGRNITARLLQVGKVDWDEEESGTRAYRAKATLSFLVLERDWYLDTGAGLDTELRLA